MPTTELTRQIAGVLRAELGRSQHTQEWLATRVGLSQSQLSKVLRGLRPMDLEQLETACALFGRTMLDVVTEAQSRLTSGGVISAAPRMPTDPRGLILFLMRFEEYDDRLHTLLAQVESQTGIQGDELQRLTSEIRRTRREELENALAALPPDQKADGF